MALHALSAVPAGKAMASFVILMILFWTLETLWPEDRTQSKWRRDSKTDMCYWFLDYGTRFVASVVVLIAVVIMARVLPRAGLSQISHQPAWLQGIEILLLGDLIGYWSHRIFHTNRALWPIHAVHHSPEQIDWLAAARVHPLDTIITRLVTVLPIYLLGFSGAGLAPYAVFLAIYPIFLHANVAWSYGPLKYAIASPAFHRWHHSSERAALDKNFSGLFPFIDVIFGTAYFPRRHPARYGLYREQMPSGVVGQFLYPFRKRGCVEADRQRVEDNRFVERGV